MPFRGLTMLKSRKLVIKGGLCYGFAMVYIQYLFVDISGLCLFRNFVLAPAPGLVRTKL